MGLKWGAHSPLPLPEHRSSSLGTLGSVVELARVSDPAKCAPRVRAMSEIDAVTMSIPTFANSVVGIRANDQFWG